MATKVGPVARCLKAVKCRNFDGRVADGIQQFLMPPDIRFKRRDVEIADYNCRVGKGFRPARHTFDEIELLSEFRIEGAVGNVATRRDIDVFEADTVG